MPLDLSGAPSSDAFDRGRRVVVVSRGVRRLPRRLYLLALLAGCAGLIAILAASPSPSVASDPQPELPLRAAFYYPWYPEGWERQDTTEPFTVYTPALGAYNSSDPALIRKHIDAMQYGHIAAGILSWWGPGTPTNARVQRILDATAGSSFRWAIYYEPEGTDNPTVRTLAAHLTYLRDHYGSDPSFLRINGRFVVFVYGQDVDDCGMVRRWHEANAGINAYIVLKVFPGYQRCLDQPDGWHQYAPAHPADGQGQHSFTISPGFQMPGEEPRLRRDLIRWRRNIRDMIASGARFQLITTFNEWGEGTAVEAAAEWSSPSGYGAYLDALHDNGSRLAPSAP